ncbi:MAG: hypothetical protein BYD32DRAFT_452157 [Podila humilis]|nr:MAG: hypothetical protein BYD32DRAFT_452157 [Podila humilis]
MVKLRILVGAMALLLVPTASAQSTTTTTRTSGTATQPTSTSTATTDFILPSAAPIAPFPTSSPPPTTPTSPMLPDFCPGPLIPNSRNLTIATCSGKCCIRCPAIESFYKPDVIQNVLKTTYATRQVSLAFSVFLAISYLVLPGKRAQPHISVLFLTVSLSLWYVAFDLMPGISNACINEFEQSTSHNSRLCGAQGVLIIYLTQTSALWCSLLIYKLHLLAVWRVDFIDRHYVWFTAFCWVFPMAFAIPVAVKGIAEYPGIGFSCLVRNENLNTYLFYPTAVYMYPAMLCHVITVAKMIQLAVMSSKIDTGLSQLSTNARMKITTTMQAKRLLRGQWRPALMAGAAMTALTVFWLFYFVDAHRIAIITPTTDWVMQWYKCLYVQAARGLDPNEIQTTCAKTIASNLPSIPWFTAAEMLLALLGVIVTMVFISKSEFWQEWSFLLSNLFSRGKLGNSRGRTPGASGSPTMNNNPNGPDTRGRFESYNNDFNTQAPEKAYFSPTQPMSPRKGTPGTQWYDMDDLLDKEYDEKTHNTELTLNASYGSRSSPPRYPSKTSQDLHTGDILYRPPAQEPNNWTPSAHTLSSPTYLTPSTNERYVDTPVVPLPVPRASLKVKANLQQQQQQQPQPQPQPQVFLSSPPQSPKLTQTTSLSPMPSKPILVSGGALPRQMQTDSSSGSSPRSSSSKKAAYYSNDSGDKIMVASRESIGSMSKGVNHGVTSDPTRINTVGRSQGGTVQFNEEKTEQRVFSLPPSVELNSEDQSRIWCG